MIREFPPKVNAIINDDLPASQKMWWVRGVVLGVSQAERPTEKPEKQNPGGRLRDLVLKIGDLDNPDDGYDVQIEGIHHEVEIEDVVSLLGHEKRDARQVSYPRLFINHNTGEFTRAYPLATRLHYGVVPLVEHKYWLSVRLSAASSFAAKIGVAIFLLVVCPVLFLAVGLLQFLTWLYGPFGFFLFLLLGVGALPALAVLLVTALYVRWLNMQARFSYEPYFPPFLFVQNLQDYFGYLCSDITPLYEKLANALKEHVLKNPAPEIDFVPVERGTHTVGIFK